MKTLKIQSVNSLYTQNLKNGGTRENAAVIMSDGHTAHIGVDYLKRKCELIGLTFNEFLRSPEDFEIQASNDETTMILRKEGVTFDYEDANGNSQTSTPSSTYWEIRGSFNVKMSDKAKIVAQASASLADKMIASLGLDLGAIASSAKASVEKEVEQKVVIPENPEVIN